MNHAPQVSLLHLANAHLMVLTPRLSARVAFSVELADAIPMETFVLGQCTFDSLEYAY